MGPMMAGQKPANAMAEAQKDERSVPISVLAGFPGRLQ
jgi:hypothetical protein